MEFFVLRHGNAEKVPDGSPYEVEAARCLTPLGQRQALERGALFGYPHFDLSLSSPMVRTLQTLQFVRGYVCQDPIIVLPQLCWIPGTRFNDVLGETFEALLYQPLAAYRRRSGPIFDEHAREAWRVVKEWIKHLALDENCKILVVGHAVLIAAFGCVAADSPNADHILSSISFDECAGYKLDIRDGHLVNLRTLRPLTTT